MSVSCFASSALLAECLVSHLSVKALRVEGFVSYSSIAAFRAQRNCFYIKKGIFWCSLMNSIRVPGSVYRGVPSSRRSGAGTSWDRRFHVSKLHVYADTRKLFPSSPIMIHIIIKLCHSTVFFVRTWVFSSSRLGTFAFVLVDSRALTSRKLRQ